MLVVLSRRATKPRVMTWVNISLHCCRLNMQASTTLHVEYSHLTSTLIQDYTEAKPG